MFDGRTTSEDGSSAPGGDVRLRGFRHPATVEAGRAAALEGVAPGTAWRIMTGIPVPSGAEAGRVMFSGSELPPPGTRPHGAQIADSNGPMLTALVERDGGMAADLCPLPDGESALRAALARPGAEVIIIAGAASVGREDRVPLLVAELGQLPAHGLAVRRGRRRMVNRNPGSGTRVLLDRLPAGLRPDGYGNQPRTPHAVAAAVAQGRAHWGMTLDTIATAAGLGFLFVQEERYDLAVPDGRRSRPAVRALLGLLDDPAVRARLRALGFTG